ncbi:MAG: DUF1573 domain-containing protein [Prevotella sp.]|nr:DUF1573 domain-containing protein [Prevotella sp.]MBR1556549.1 DUF1573 domain-containing protein [Prevotella sp.]MBR1901916.1 DUF1573 domain-containing protein [Bacteroidaceae bacterium]
MLVADTLVAIGLATISLGTIQEADGVQERTFWLRNNGTEAVNITQGYTSCGCTTIQFAKDEPVAVGDSSKVVLRFNPQGKGGEFEETGTIVYGPNRKRIHLSMIGTCITSEETLMRQFPIRISDDLRLSVNHFDLGIMHVGDTKERNVIILHRDENNRQERISIKFTVDAQTPKGLQHISYPIKTSVQGKEQNLTIIIDALIK